MDKKKESALLIPLKIASIKNVDYLYSNQTDTIISTLSFIDREKCQQMLSSWRLKSFLINELIRHRDSPEPRNKFSKDKSDNEAQIYRYENIRSASSTVIDESNYFSLRINRLIVNNRQVGLSLSAPKTDTLSAYFAFLFEKKIPGIHILLQDIEFSFETDMPKYHQPLIEHKSNNFIQVTHFTNKQKGLIKNQLFLPIEGIPSLIGQLKIHVKKEGVYNKGKASETQVTKLTLSIDNQQHSIKILQSVGWKDQKSIKLSTLDELLEIRKNAFDGMQKSLVITHCKAGVGRTGTLLAAEAIYHLKAPLIETIIALRDSRNHSMVQTNAQLNMLFLWVKKNEYPLV